MAGNAPDGVSDAIWSGEIVEWRSGRGGFGHLVDGVGAAVSEKDGAGVGIEGEYVAGPVILFAFPGFFVTEDEIIFVVIDVDAADDAGLGFAVHDLPVGVEAIDAFADECTVEHEFVQAGGGGVIDFRCIGIVVRGEVDVGPYDMEEAEGVAFGEGSSFIAVDHIVGYGGDVCGEFGEWAECWEGFDTRHSGRILGGVEGEFGRECVRKLFRKSVEEIWLSSEGTGVYQRGRGVVAAARLGFLPTAEARSATVFAL